VKVRGIGAQQNPALLFDHYGQKEGFLAKSSRGIVKGSDGFMYVATERGLAKYDGHTFEFFGSVIDDSTTFSSNYLTALEEDDHGRLWIISDKDLNVFDIKSKKVIQLYNKGGNKEKYRPYAVFFDNKNKTMWIGAHDGLYYSNGKEINIIKSPITANDNASNRGHEINMIRADNHNGLWCAHRHGLTYIDTKTFKYKKYTFPTLQYREKGIPSLISVYVDKDSIIWAGSWFYGLFKLDLKSGKEKLYNNFFNNTILSINKSRMTDGRYLWVGTLKGLYLFDTQLEKYYQYYTNDFLDKSKVPGAVWDIYEEGKALWLATHYGVHKYDYKKQNIERHVIFKNDKLLEPNPRSVAVESNTDVLWIHYADYKTLRYDVSSEKEIPIPNKVKKYLAKEIGIFELYIDANNLLYISTTEFGLVIYDINQDKIIIEGGKYFNKPNEWVFSFSEEKNKVFLTTGLGFYSFIKKTNTIQEEEKINACTKRDKGNFCRGIVPYNDHSYWVLTTNSSDEYLLYLMTVDGNIIASSKNQKINLKEIGELNHISTDQNRNLILGSFYGLGLVSVKNKTLNFRILNKELNSNITHFRQIEIDNKNNLWTSTNFGISYFNIEKNITKNYSFETSGLGTLENPYIYYNKLRDKLFVFQSYGYDIISNQANENNTPCSIQVTKIKVNDHEVNKNDIKYIHHTQNHIYFEYSLLDFTDPNEHKYYIKLEGADEDWKLSNKNSVDYIKLSPGMYNFHVKAINSSGQITQNEVSIPFEIEYPFYRTWWFFTMIFILSIAAVYAIFRYRELQKEKLEKLRRRIAQDLHDDIGSSISNIKLLSELQIMKGSTDSNFPLIVSNAKYVLENMSDIIWNINPQNDDFNKLVDKIKLNAIEVLEKHNIELEFDIDEDFEGIKMDLNKRRDLYLLCKEAINNIAKYAQAKKVKLTLHNNNRMIEFTIIDDGCGFDINKVSKGNGLKFMKSRAQSLNGTIDIQSKEGEFTSIKLTFKV
jgi:signal transduction histidine kinase/ligand-binding sensor domain-containing protein